MEMIGDINNYYYEPMESKKRGNEGVDIENITEVSIPFKRRDNQEFLDYPSKVDVKNNQKRGLYYQGGGGGSGTSNIAGGYTMSPLKSQITDYQQIGKT